MREVRFAVDSPLEEEGYEPSVPVEDGSFSSPRSSVQGPALPRERSSIPQKRRGHSGVRYMGFAALNPAASRALAIERGGEGFSIRRFDGAQLGEKAFLILTRRNAVGPLCRGLAPYGEQNLLQVRHPRLGAQMSAWIATALAVAIGAMSAITSVNAGSCGPGSTPNCFNIPTTIDFSSVPEISKQIVSEEKPGQKQKQPTGEPPAAAPYTGPIFGASPRPGRTPVVGYSWSLE
jgi:hypothetical protein